MTPLEFFKYLLDGPFAPFAVMCVITLIACDFIERKGRSR
jgi:hypothetical protein